MLIAATGDIHSPHHYEDFIRAVEELKVKPNLFLMVGDVVDRGMVDEYEKIHNVLFGKITCPIVACFGNTEFIPDKREELKQKYKDIRFLDDQSIRFEVGSLTVGIFGTTGSLDVPTNWQRANIPNIEKIYRERLMIADKHFQRMLTHYKIFLTHYAPTYKTLEGENPRFFGSMGCQAFENVIIQKKPDLVLHGHSHRGTKMVWIDTVPVFNVSLPLNKKIVVIDTDELKPGITKFV
jgi:Icc-related predicted phosphoesterase